MVSASFPGSSMEGPERESGEPLGDEPIVVLRVDRFEERPIAARHVAHLQEHLTRHRARLGSVVQAEPGERLRHVGDRMVLEQAASQIVVHGVAEAAIHAPSQFVRRAWKEEPRLMPAILQFPELHQVVEADALLAYRFLVSSAHIEVEDGARDAGIGVFRIGTPYGAEGARQIDVVGVEPAQKVTGGSSEALLQSVILSLIWLANPVGQVGLVPTDDLYAAVGGAAINDDVLQVWVLLVENGQDSLFEEGSLFV